MIRRLQWSASIRARVGRIAMVMSLWCRQQRMLEALGSTTLYWQNPWGGGRPLHIPSTPTLIKEDTKGVQLTWMEHWLPCPLHPHMWENVNVIKPHTYESYESFGFLYRRMFERRLYVTQLLFTVLWTEHEQICKPSYKILIWIWIVIWSWEDFQTNFQSPLTVEIKGWHVFPSRYMKLVTNCFSCSTDWLMRLWLTKKEGMWGHGQLRHHWESMYIVLLLEWRKNIKKFFFKCYK